PGVDKGCGIPGYENEQIRGVAEAVIPRGDPVHDVVRNVVQKNCPVRHPAKQIEPQVASFFGEGCVDFHGCRFDVTLSEGSSRRTRRWPCDWPRLSRRSIMTIPVAENIARGAGNHRSNSRKIYLYYPG